MGETNSNAISRREAMKIAAKAAGVTTFATPVVIEVFSAPAVGQTGPPLCSPLTDSDAVYGTIDAGGSWNTNCGGGCTNGRYNGQNAHFTFAGGEGTVQVGTGGIDNFCVHQSYYSISAPGFRCTPMWSLQNCSGVPGTSTSALGDGPLPYCPTACTPGGDSSVRLVLSSIVCCPDP
jgi:hypothetical protein